MDIIISLRKEVDGEKDILAFTASKDIKMTKAPLIS